MYIIYSIVEACAELEARYEEFVAKGNYPLHVKAYQLDKDCAIIVEALPKLKEWHQLVLDIINDSLNYKLKWAPKTDLTEIRLSEILPLYTMKLAESQSEDRLHASETLWEEVIDPVYLKLTGWVDETVGSSKEDMWRIWYIKAFEDRIILEKGLDYRVYDWEQRMKSGEWCHEAPNDLCVG